MLLSKLIQWIRDGTGLSGAELRGMLFRFWLVAVVVVMGWLFISTMMDFGIRDVEKLEKEVQATLVCFYASRADNYFHQMRCPNHPSTDLIAIRSDEIVRLKLEPCPACKPLDVKPAF